MDTSANNSGSPKRRPRRHHIALTKQFDNDGNFKCFRIDCGHVVRSGKRVRKTFYLGQEETIARRLSTKVRDKWVDIRASTYGTKPVWNDGDLAEIQLWLNGKEVPLSPDERASMMCYDLIDKYIDFQAERRDAKKISWHFWRANRRALGWLKRHVLPNMPMRLVNEDWLRKISMAFQTPFQSKRTGRPISSQTAVTRLNIVKCFFEWANRSGYWNAPKLFYSEKSLWFMRKKDRVVFDGGRDKSREKPVGLAMDELKLIWQYVQQPRPRIGHVLKALFLLGLNAAFGHSEFGYLHVETGREEDDAGRWRVHVEDGEWRIVGPRPKTKVWADGIRLWPETVAAMEQARAADNEWDLFFLNQWGRPIHVGHERGEPCSLSWWTRLRDDIERETGVRVHSLKYLRKTAAQLVRRVSGNGSLAEMLLVHSEHGMARAYHAEDFQRLNAALNDVRKLLFAELEPKPQLRLVG